MFFADVIERLNVLRGRGMASMYSWSSKRYFLDSIHHFFCSKKEFLDSMFS